MTDDRTELANLLRGFSAIFDYAREGSGDWVARDGVMPAFTYVETAGQAGVGVGSSVSLAADAVAVSLPAMVPAMVPAIVPSSVQVAAKAPAQMVVPQSAERAPTPAPFATARTVEASAAPLLRIDAAPRVVSEKIPLVDGITDRRVALAVLAEHAASCTRCVLHEKRTQTVFHRGNSHAELFFVGEAPGADEDKTGVPFVGAAGQLLDKIIAAMGLTGDDVYIANVAKCRPPSNRVPEPTEAAECGSYLLKQIEIVRPKILVAWGKTAASFLLGRTDSMTRLRGRWHAYQDTPLLVTWHPSYLLRTPAAKRETWDDMKLVLAKLKRTESDRVGE